MAIVKTATKYVVAYDPACKGDKHELGTDEALQLPTSTAILIARDLEDAGYKGIEVLESYCGPEIDWLDHAAIARAIAEEDAWNLANPQTFRRI